jgi:hypothetical protein
MLQGETKPIRKLIEEKFEEIKAITESKRPILPLETCAWYGTPPPPRVCHLVRVRTRIRGCRMPWNPSRQCVQASNCERRRTVDRVGPLSTVRKVVSMPAPVVAIRCAGNCPCRWHYDCALRWVWSTGDAACSTTPQVLLCAVHVM